MIFIRAIRIADQVEVDRWAKEAHPVKAREWYPEGEFEFVEYDATPEEEAAKARRYLKQTDWYVIRELDSGVPMPLEVKQARQAAREKL